MDYKKVFNAVEEQLDNPTPKLLSIREQLKNNKDINLNKLTTIELDVNEEEYEILCEYAAEHNCSVDEIIWLYMEQLIEELDTHEKS